MAQPPIIRDFAFITSSVPFPTANNNQTGAPPELRRQRTGSNSSSSSSSGVGPHQLRSHTISMSGRTQKQLSPVVEECEDDSSRRRLTSGRRRVGSRASHRPRHRRTSYIGHTGIMAEDLTIAMISMMPPPPRHQTKPLTRRKSMSKTKSRLQRLRQSIRARLPTMRSVRVWKLW